MAFSTKILVTGLGLAVAMMLPVDGAMASGRMTMCNGIGNVDVISLSVKDGTVSGFSRIKPGKCVAVTVKTDNGKCAAWVYARIEDQSAATVLANTCGGAYAVTLRGQNGRGGSMDLNIKQLK